MFFFKKEIWFCDQPHALRLKFLITLKIGFIPPTLKAKIQTTLLVDG